MIYIDYIHSIYIYLYMMNTQHGYKIMTKILTKADNIFQFPPKKSSVSIGKNSLKVVAPTTLLVEEYHARILPLRQTSQIHE